MNTRDKEALDRYIQDPDYPDNPQRQRDEVVSEVYDVVVEEVESRFKFFEVAFDDGVRSSPKEFEDDGYLHICRGKYRFVFYNGQERGCLMEKDLAGYAKRVDKLLARLRKRGVRV